MTSGNEPPPPFEIEKWDGSRIRVCRRDYRGREFIDIRAYIKNGNGEYIPLAKGVTIPPDTLPKLIAALSQINSEYEGK